MIRESGDGIGRASVPRRSRVLTIAIVVVSSAVLTLGGCSRDDDLRATRALGKRVDVTVTTDGGRDLVVRRGVPLRRGMTALDALRYVADVRMGPGGIIMQVNGLGGGRLRTFGPERAGWFYRVNGVESDKDPARFRLKQGSSLWFDLRRYDIYPRVPVAVGVFPQPFFTGYRDNLRPIRIAYGSKFRKDAELVREEVFQQLSPEVEPIESDGLFGGTGLGGSGPRPSVAVRTDRANLVIARWEEARLDPYIADLGLDPRGYGLTVWVEGTDIRAQAVDDEFSHELADAEGLVWASTVDGEPDSAVVMLVTGTTDEGVRAAARALKSGGFQFALAGAVDRSGNVVPF